ncbi:hypothetical protein D9Q98_006468 [Chlorella vulgaris]|uniref:Transmembrane protein n=1 Tax=Chlorella vulgaris TaxID=3077 RepID=A0A9D4YV95_CHLVU|nr:hypothetical protein D9Q98_006468 [Chlorella vulgaris]
MEEPAEIRVFEEGSPEPEATSQTPAGTPTCGALTLSLPPSTATVTAGGTDLPRRWSGDLSSSMHEWEVVSSGRHSHCGSSPRSVSPSDAYDSEGEAAQDTERRAATAEPEPNQHCSKQDQEAGAGAQSSAPEDGPVAAEEQLPDMHAAAEASAAAEEVEDAGEEPPKLELSSSAETVVAAATATTAPTAVLGGVQSELNASSLDEDGSQAAVSAVGDSPRSSYQQPSGHASDLDLYSLSQDGSGELLSSEEELSSLMRQGEPDQLHPATSEHSAHSSEKHEHDSAHLDQPLPQALASAPAATAAAAARGAYCAASQQLCQLADSVSAALDQYMPAAAGVARRVMHGVAALVSSLRDGVRALPQTLWPLAQAVGPAVTAAGQRVQQAAQRTRKQLGYNKLKFARMAVALLGVACGGLALALYKSWAEQARLAAMLTKRECELSRLLMKVFELQRNITQHRSTPLVRHVSGVSSMATAIWPADAIIVV